MHTIPAISARYAGSARGVSFPFVSMIPSACTMLSWVMAAAVPHTLAARTGAELVWLLLRVAPLPLLFRGARVNRGKREPGTQLSGCAVKRSQDGDPEPASFADGSPTHELVGLGLALPALVYLPCRPADPDPAAAQKRPAARPAVAAGRR